MWRMLLVGLALLASCDKTPAAGAAQSPPGDEDSAPASDPGPGVAGSAPTDSPSAQAEKPTAPEPAPVDPLTLDATASASVGSPTEGHLTTSVALPLIGPGYAFNPRKDPQRRHGTVELVQALLRSTASVEAALPGNKVTFGDLSMPLGGEIGGHASHRAGRDVDVMFYLLDAKGAPFDGKAIPLEPNGSGTDYNDLTTAADDVSVKLDVPRTWAFVEALVGDDRNHINRIFVVEHVRSMLLAHAKKIDAPRKVRDRFGHLACQPNFPHDDHMHIRFYCEPDDIKAGCLDTKPFFPWHLAQLKSAGLKPVLAGRRTTPRPKLTSVDDAAKKAKAKVGAFDPEVSAFLERRKAWAKKPHPGRKWCR